MGEVRARSRARARSCRAAPRRLSLRRLSVTRRLSLISSMPAIRSLLLNACKNQSTTARHVYGQILSIVSKSILQQAYSKHHNWRARLPRGAPTWCKQAGASPKTKSARNGRQKRSAAERHGRQKKSEATKLRSAAKRRSAKKK